MLIDGFVLTENPAILAYLRRRFPHAGLYPPDPVFGILLSPIIAAAAMSLSSFSVVANALRLRVAKL